MYVLLLLLRIIHIGCGVFWAGSILFLAFYVFPAVQRSGPDGGKFMQAISSTNRFAQVLPLMALLTILSGAVLMWRQSGEFTPEWFATKYGLSLTIGGALAVIALIQGMSVNKPAVTRIERIGQRIQAHGGVPNDAERAEMIALRARVIGSTQLLAVWLSLAVIAMAIARYL